MNQEKTNAVVGGLSSPENPIRPDSAFVKKVEADTGISINACYGCKKCSNGCPLSFAMDYKPYQVVRLAQYGLVSRLKDSHTIWVCSSCQTCLTRCPNEVDIPRFMDYLKETVVKEGRKIPEPRTKLFHRAFLSEVKARGRVFEGGLMAKYLIGSGEAFGLGAFKYALLGLAMLRKGRLKLVPAGVKDRKWLKQVFKGYK